MQQPGPHEQNENGPHSNARPDVTVVIKGPELDSKLPAEKSVKEPVNEPVNEPVKEPVKEPAEMSVKEPVKEPVKESVKESDEESDQVFKVSFVLPGEPGGARFVYEKVAAGRLIEFGLNTNGIDPEKLLDHSNDLAKQALGAKNKVLELSKLCSDIVAAREQADELHKKMVAEMVDDHQIKNQKMNDEHDNTWAEAIVTHDLSTKSASRAIQLRQKAREVIQLRQKAHAVEMEDLEATRKRKEMLLNQASEARALSDQMYAAAEAM